MTQLIRLFLILFVITVPARGQDLLNETNSAKFADYLFKTQQFDLAAQEYERLVFLAPTNSDYKLTLIQSYRQANDITSAHKRFSLFYGDSLMIINQFVGAEYLKILILQNNLNSAQSFIKLNSNLDYTTRLNYQTYIYLAESNWPRADSLIRQNSDINPKLVKLTNDAMHIKYKKPFLAVTFSAILPGSGKVYSGYWKDGLISFIFIGANAWQTYRGFSKYGPHKAHGWIFGGLTAGFYFGNIYGSLKSAKKHNKIANGKIHNESQNFIISTF